ncbi:aminotransferase class I/II-fold pyridoxal phosphate-dependent enzyme [Comamonas composti]|uniref:aminotransferase class I/II-fold pyridoxal phosphate-dependent enzyme n=1 Tax=Comamonas composti TaxID=408558 RepID=UPI00041FEEF3|nr:aminotransferase class I/II-fold pyridoxal phosphate-dependent enzyme [Comamonas composti]
MQFSLPVHGGSDAQGTPVHDFSTNSNACGPCPLVLQALGQAHAAHYPDPHYTELRARLAAFHGVQARQVLVAASASEFIHRITAHARREGAAGVSLPQHHYGDYAHAARIWGLKTLPRGNGAPPGPGLHWACAPASPLGRDEDVWPLWQQAAGPGSWYVLDCAYVPLRLGADIDDRLRREAMGRAWQIWTPNKALGLTGVRAAYVLAPQAACDAEIAALVALACSWPVGAHGVAMLQAWTEAATQQWLAHSRELLREWKAQQLALCACLGWEVLQGHEANYFVARLPDVQQARMPQGLHYLREQGLKLRDCTSFGLPGHVRLGVLAPASQLALEQAWMNYWKQAL